jgi:hypothetical protein
MKMNGISLKCMGTKEDLELFIKNTEKYYMVVSTSTIKPCEQEGLYHQYISLFPKPTPKPETAE